jgi:hypothetical protein
VLERKRTQEEIQNFLHEINNPLSACFLILEVLKRHVDVSFYHDSDIRDCIASLQQKQHAMKKSIDDLSLGLLKNLK